MKKILIVEDDKFLNKALNDKLTRSEFDVHSAFDGESGLKEAKKIKPDMMLLDLVMPRMNGFEVLQNMVKDPTLKKIKVIVLSNLGQVEDVEKAKKFGAVDYMIKADFSLKEILLRINKHLK